MQYFRLLRASICGSALLLAAPAFAFNGGSGGHSGGHAGFSGGSHSMGSSGGSFRGASSGARMNFATAGGNAGYSHGGYTGGGSYPHGGYSGGNWHGGGGYPGYGYGWGAPYVYGYNDPDDGDYAYDTPDSDYSYADNGYGDNGYGPGVYAQGDDQGAGPYTPGPEASTQLGNYCRTPVKVCQLYQSANLGADCSCRDGAGRAYGQVSP